MLTVNRLGLPIKLRRSLACTNSIENMMGTVRRVCRNVKRWRNAAMALRWTAAGMMEAAKGFRRLKAYKHLPVLRDALAAHQSKYVTQRVEHDADSRIASSMAMPASPTSTKSGASPAINSREVAAARWFGGFGWFVPFAALCSAMVLSR
jgi:hypothetical protein